MQGRLAFRWPLFPTEILSVGLELPTPSYDLPLHAPHTADHDDGNDENPGDGPDFGEYQDGASRRYHPAMILNCCRLASMLKPGSSLKAALTLAAEVMGVDTEKADSMQIPHRSTLQRAQVKVDLCIMLWSRYLWNHDMHCVMTLLADASMQDHQYFLPET